MIPEDQLRSAKRLRKAVHLLAKKVMHLDLNSKQLEDIAETLEEKTDELLGEPAPKWWGADATEQKTRSGSYRSRSLFQGEMHPFSPELVWDDYVAANGELGYQFKVTLSDLYEGPPSAVHGGYIAGLFDELLGAVQSLDNGDTGYTAKLSIKYRSFTPVNSELRFQGWIVQSSGRRISVKGQCWEGEKLCAEAEALFLRLKERESENNG